jgi:hypothetical protein
LKNVWKIVKDLEFVIAGCSLVVNDVERKYFDQNSFAENEQVLEM